MARLRPWIELVTHELRNPLSSVKMAVQTLSRNSGLSERDQRRLSIANREIRALERLIELLSEYGRDSQSELERRPLSSFLEDAIPSVAPELEERGVQVNVSPELGLLSGQADVKRLRPVLAALLLNLASAAPAGCTVSVAPWAKPGRVGFELSGPSTTLSAEELDSLFEPFGSRLAKGAGLSLAALQQVMRSAGGDVTVENKEGKFFFYLSFLT